MRKEVESIRQNIGKVIIGREEVIYKLIAALLADGHVLLEDVPGTGKTRLARAMAATFSLDFGRIQFTPDMLPADITGLHIYSRQSEQFELKKGPVFTNILLADEINRATPRTQAGLLECMEERQVTIDGDTLKLESPFFVIATQNPIETAGTFPLPEAQMDRFMMKVSMGLPDREEEIRILETYKETDPLKTLTPAAGGDGLAFGREVLAEWKAQVAMVYVHPLMEGYLADITLATRAMDKVLMGVSPRGTLALMRACKAWAWMEGREYCIPDDAKRLASSVMAHRLAFSYGESLQTNAEKLINEVLSSIPVPTEDFNRK